MSGFETGARVKQFGSILRGFGPPVPQAGVVGDLYIDTQTWQLFNKRFAEAGVDPWGHYLLIVPPTYRTTLKWFSAYPPGDDIGANGDYCLLWAGWANYGMQPLIYGPRLTSGWPENGEGLDVAILSSSVLPVGLADEGAAFPFSSSTQLVVVGLLSEYILPIPVAASAGSLVEEVGLQSMPAAVVVNIDPLYTASDSHAV